MNGRQNIKHYIAKEKRYEKNVIRYDGGIDIQHVIASCNVTRILQIQRDKWTQFLGWWYSK